MSLIYPLWNHVTARKRYQILFSETDKQATKILRNIRRAATNKNGRYARLLRDFGQELKIETDNGHELVFASGGQISCSSHGSSDRGSRDEEQRPDLVLGDDIENLKTIATTDLRDNTQEWWEAEIFPMRDPHVGRVIWVGTMLHEDAAMARVAASGGYQVIKKQAIIREPTNQALWEECAVVWARAQNDGGVGVDASRAFYEAHRDAMDTGAVVLWPARHDYFDLWSTRRLIGSTRFATEFQSEPVASGNQIVTPTQIHDFRLETVVEDGKTETYLIGHNGVVVKLSECLLYEAIDPAISEKNTADFFAMGVMAAHPNGTRWFLDFIHDRMPYDRQVTGAVQKHVEWRQRVGDRIQTLGIETVMYQKALKQGIDRAATAAGLSIPTRELRPVTDKIFRLTRHQPTFEQGRVYMQKQKHAFAVDEVCGYTRDGKIKPKHDDAMDVVVYCLMLAEEVGLASMVSTFTFDG